MGRIEAEVSGKIGGTSISNFPFRPLSPVSGFGVGRGTSFLVLVLPQPITGQVSYLLEEQRSTYAEYLSGAICFHKFKFI